MTEDPEQRIADLERGVSTSGALPDAPRRTMLIGWVVLGLLATGLAVGGGLILAGHSQRTVPGGPVTAEPPPHTNLPTEPPVPTPTTPIPATPTPATVPPVPTGGPTMPTLPNARPPGKAGSLSVTGIERNETFACEGRNVDVSGVDNTVILTGRCPRVEVSGVGNSVRVDTAAEIIVSGLENDVVFLAGDPLVEKSGLRNEVNRG